MNIDTILGSIKDKSLDEIKQEFKSLFELATTDQYQFIREMASQLESALSYRAQGLIPEEDVQTLLRKQKKIIQIHANTVQIDVRARIQKLLYRLFDISIDILVKAIVPI